MNRPTRLVLLTLAIIATGCLAAGCAQGANVKKALASASAKVTTSGSGQASPKARATVQHTVTASAAPPGSQATPAPSHVAGSTASSLLWLWILLGVLLIALVAILLIHHSRRRSAFTASWRSQAADASAKGAALYDAISLDEFQDAWESPGAEARWVDTQRRADDLTQQLYRLRDSAPSGEDRLCVADVLASLQAVRSAMEATRTPGGASAQQRAPMSYLLQSFGESLRALRSPDAYRP